LSVSSLNWSPSGSTINFPIYTNRSALAYFNATCSLKLSRLRLSGGFVTTKEGQYNNWSFSLVHQPINSYGFTAS
nr:hypothetical protein [Candidatus Sigynarchaeota archaeon]